MAIVTDNKYLKYNETFYRYELTNEVYTAFHIDMDYFKDEEKEELMYIVSELTYLYCADTGRTVTYFNKYTNPKNILAYIIFKNENEEVETMQNLQIALLRYFVSNGDSATLGDQTGIDLQTLQSISLSDLRGNREVSSRFERILNNSSLKLRGNINITIPVDEFKVGW